MPSALRPLQRQRGRRGGRLEADGEEHDLAVRVLARDPQRVERRVDHPDVGALRLGVEQRVLRARYAQHVAEAGEDHPLVARDRDAVIDPAHRNHAHRAARAVDELDVRGQQVVDPVLVDRVGVPATHLHHLVVATGLELGRGSARPAPDRAGRHGTRRRTSINAPQVADGHAGVDEELVAERHRRDQLDRHVVAGSLSRRRRRRRRHATSITRIGTPSSPHVMQCSSSGAHRAAAASSLIRSRSP